MKKVKVTEEVVTAANLTPLLDECPTEYADRLGSFYTSQVEENHKKEKGQYFTPSDIARYMASLSQISRNEVKILDPGCGIGILSAALCENIAVDNKVSSIELVAFETDVEILPLSELCLNYLADWLKQHNVKFTYFLCKNDFILHNSNVLTEERDHFEYYDFIISNPPYFKLANNDKRVIAAKKVIYGQSNIYSIFLLIASKLLGENGQLIFITPRSFCSGSYFRLFREIFFSTVLLQNVHLFDSRKDSFKRDKVLQENIIITATPRNNIENNNHEICIFYSNGVKDIYLGRAKKYTWEELINVDSYQKILFLPTSEIDERVIDIFKKWTGSLKSYGLEISTGPVVAYRTSSFIKRRKGKYSVPLFWLHNVENMNISWPKRKGSEEKLKGQYISNTSESQSVLVDNANCVLLRRFSSKEENRRLIAAPYLKENSATYTKIGIENHLNYIYSTKSELTTEETYGLSAILNSRLFDVYFRTFNGNTNVSATELREFPLPDMQHIRQLGGAIFSHLQTSKEFNVDNLVSEEFNILLDIFKKYE